MPSLVEIWLLVSKAIAVQPSFNFCVLLDSSFGIHLRWNSMLLLPLPVKQLICLISFKPFFLCPVVTYCTLSCWRADANSYNCCSLSCNCFSFVDALFSSRPSLSFRVDVLYVLHFTNVIFIIESLFVLIFQSLPHTPASVERFNLLWLILIHESVFLVKFDFYVFSNLNWIFNSRDDMVN